MSVVQEDKTTQQINRQTTDHFLAQQLSEFGQIAFCEIKRGRSGKSRRFAFVVFEEQVAADKLLGLEGSGTPDTVESKASGTNSSEVVVDGCKLFFKPSKADSRPSIWTDLEQYLHN